MKLEDLPGDGCIFCGAGIDHRRTNAIYCSTRCRQADYQALTSRHLAEERAGLACQECGGPVEALRAGKLFCSERCAMRSWQRRKFGERECIACGERFVPRTVVQRFCGKPCFYHHERRGVPLGFDRICPICGAAFRVHSDVDRQVHCSRRCAWAARRKRASVT